MGAAAAVILMKERQLVEAFERAGATTLASAGFPADIGVEPSGIGWRAGRCPRGPGRRPSLFGADIEIYRVELPRRR